MPISKELAPDVVDLLTAQHSQIRRGFIAAMLPLPGRGRRFDTLRKLLAVHEAAEEAHVHPVMRKVGRDGRDFVRKRLLEEAAAKKLLKDLERIGPGHRGFARKFWALQLAVLRHARREEKEEFEFLRTAVSPWRRRMLGAESLLTQFLAPTRPHPLLGNQLANKLAAPVMGPIDRARDLISTRR